MGRSRRSITNESCPWAPRLDILPSACVPCSLFEGSLDAHSCDAWNTGALATRPRYKDARSELKRETTTSKKVFAARRTPQQWKAGGFRAIRTHWESLAPQMLPNLNKRRNRCEVSDKMWMWMLRPFICQKTIKIFKKSTKIRLIFDL